MKKGSGEYSNPDMFALAVTLDSKQVTQAWLGSPCVTESAQRPGVT